MYKDYFEPRLFVRFVNVFCLRFSCFGWHFSALAAAAAAVGMAVVAARGIWLLVLRGWLLLGGCGGVGGGGKGRRRKSIQFPQVVADLISRVKDGEPVDWRYDMGEDVYVITKAPQLTIHIRKHLSSPVTLLSIVLSSDSLSSNKGMVFFSSFHS
jgi:hypothetical protein